MFYDIGQIGASKSRSFYENWGKEKCGFFSHLWLLLYNVVIILSIKNIISMKAIMT